MKSLSRFILYREINEEEYLSEWKRIKEEKHR
nr:MAG TPA: hypothetical protein [Caudoviricetes sp.]